MTTLLKPNDNDDARRIRDLEFALRHERERSMALERRADALLEAAKRAYGMVAPRPRAREEH